MRDADLPAGLRIVQMIVLALLLGVGALAAIVALAPAPAGLATTLPLPLVAVAVTVASLVLAPLLRQGLLRAGGDGARRIATGLERDGRPEPSAPESRDGHHSALPPPRATHEAQPFARFQVATVAAAAVLEGAALLSVTTAFVTAQPGVLALAAAPLLLMLLACFPTAARWRRYAAAVPERRAGRDRA
jgi:hypothetical protein